MPKPDTAKSRGALLAVLIVGAALRLVWPGIIEFKLDEATVARAALAFVHEGIWPTLGQTTSVGLPNPPLSTYVQALPYAISRNPAVAAAFLGLLGVLAIALSYWLGRRAFDHRVGLIAAALFAAAPWAIFYSRKLWTQNLPLATLAFMLALYALVVERRSRAVGLLLPALATLVGLYAGDVVFLGVLLLALLLHPRAWRDVSWRWAAVGLVGAFLLTLPILIGLSSTLQQAGLPQAPAVSQVSFSGQAILYPFQIATGYQFHALAGDRFLEYRSQLPPLFFIDAIEMALVSLGGLYVAVRAFTAPTEQRPRYTLLALWLWLPAIVWGLVGGGHIYPHHFILLYPAQHLAAAVMLVEGAERLDARFRRLAWRAMAAGIAAMMVWNATTYLVMLRFVDSHPIDGGHSEPVHYAWDAARCAREMAQADALPVVVLTDGFDPRHDSGAAAFDAMLGDLWLYLLPGDVADLTPAGGGVRLAREGFGVYRVERLAPPEESGAPLGHLANGADLLGVSVENTPQPGEPLIVTTRWGIWGIPPSDEDYSFSVQLYGTEGERWGQADAHFMPTGCWYPGDRYAWRATLPVAAEAPSEAGYSLLVVMYAYPDLRGVAVLDESGNPTGEHVVIPLGEAAGAR
jgi:4-amino-4-deoxy-L-arabinose transferase-like glycosyltransferase